MTLHTPLWQENGSYIADIDRQLIDALFDSGGGTVGTSDLIVTQRGSGANMSVDVSAGKCVVVGSDISGQGKYLCWSDAVTNVAIAAAPGTGLSRIDLICAVVRDADADGGSNNDWVIAATTGTAASSPTAPSAPASSLVLGHVLVGANVTSIITANVSNPARLVGLSTSLRNKPSGRLYYSGSQVVAASTATQIIDLVEDYSNGGMTVGSNAIVVPIAGTYRVSAAVQWQVGGSGVTDIGLNSVEVAVNGTAERTWITDVTGTTFAGASGSDDIELEAGDTLTLVVGQGSGGNVGVKSGSANTFLSASLVSVP